MFNQAAEVLLDPDQRAAYDAAARTARGGPEARPPRPRSRRRVSTARLARTELDHRDWLDKLAGAAAGARVALIGLALLTTLVARVAVAVWYLQPSDAAIVDAAARGRGGRRAGQSPRSLL